MVAQRDPRETLRRLLSLGEAITGVRREDVEEFVRDLVSFEGDRMERVEEIAEEVFARSRRSVERLGTLLRSELQRELDTRGLGQPGELVDRAVGVLGDLLRRPGMRRPGWGDAGRGAGREDAAEASLPPLPAPTREAAPARPARPTAKAAQPAANVAPPVTKATKPAAKAATPTKKAAAKKATAKKSATEKVAAKKVATKKSAAEKSSGRAGPRRPGA